MVYDDLIPAVGAQACLDRRGVARERRVIAISEKRLVGLLDVSAHGQRERAPRYVRPLASSLSLSLSGVQTSSRSSPRRAAQLPLQGTATSSSAR